MKKILFITCLYLFATLCLNAQTNIFPPSGNVGIGTTNPTNKLVVQGDSSPNLELKNSNYSNGGFILNRTNYGHQWKWWAQSNVMYFDFSTDETNYSNKFTIKSNGNVGISNANPLDKLQISNTFVFHDGGHKVLSLLYSPGAADLDDTKYASEIRYDPISGSLHLGTSSTVTNAPTARFSITKDGNVGIGITSPNATLQVGDSNNTGTPQQEVEIKRLSLAPVCHSGSDWFFTTRDNNYANLDIGYSNNKTITLRHDGNVGIGTTTPDAKLTVKGLIHSQEVKVTATAGADFVFETDYNLPTLKKVEEFIKANKHLPEIPSAKEMQTNGLYVAEMNTKLLQKIEELTLYTINQEKRIETLEKENTTLKTQEERIAQLEEKIKLLLNKK